MFMLEKRPEGRFGLGLGVRPGVTGCVVIGTSTMWFLTESDPCRREESADIRLAVGGFVYVVLSRASTP